MTTRQISRVLAVGMALALVASACTRPKDQADRATERVVAANVDDGASGGTTAPGDTVAEGEAEGTEGQSVEEAIANGDFGTLEQVCGPAPEGQENVDSDTQGVSADELVVGTFSDPNNKARPGINQELFDTADVFTSWCNELGGIAGRQIKLVKHDSALFNVAPTMAEACRTDFYLVGGGSVLDDAGVQPRLECLLPQISGFVVTDEARLADLQSQPQNVAADQLQQGIFRYLDATFPESTGKVGLLTGNLPALITTMAQYKEAADGLGWSVAYDEQYNTVGESTWVPYAEDIKASGVKGLAYVGEPENLALLVQALANIDYQLDWVLGSPNMYDAKLTEAAGAALDAEPVYIGIGFPPFEYADQVPAIEQFLALFEQYKPDGKARTLLAVNAMSAWLLFAESVKGCGAEVTRRCVYENSIEPTDWDAGGLWSAADLTDRVAGSDCFVTVLAKPDGFEVIPWEENDRFFNCDPANLIDLKATLPAPLTLADVGKTIDDVE